MGKDTPAEPDIKCLLPEPVLLLGQALAPVAAEFQSLLGQKAKFTGPMFTVLDDVSHHMGLITRALTLLDQSLPDLMKSVVENEAATPLEVGQVVGRMEHRLWAWTDGYKQLQASRPTPDAVELHRLLSGVYQHHMATISDWLNRLVIAIRDPLAELGHQHMKPVNGAVLTITLAMTEPVEMVRLKEIVRHARQIEAPYLHRPPQHHPAKPGFWAKAGALVFGLGLANALWGGNKE